MGVVIVESRGEWSREFDSLAARIAGALGPLAVRIDHIGSTSVPGLAAKDVLDLQVIVRSLEPDEAIPEQFASIGFTSKLGDLKLRDHVPTGWTGDESAWDKLLFGPPTGERPSNVHVRVSGAPNERYALLFRDFLRANDRARELWGTFKEQLVAEVGGDRDLYVELKDPATDVLLTAAEEWARATGWGGPGGQPSPLIYSPRRWT
ncbi:MAG: GrpB family protein [Gaiellaceae bacterium]